MSRVSRSRWPAQSSWLTQDQRRNERPELTPEARQEISSNKRLFNDARKHTRKLIRRIEEHLQAGNQRAALAVQRQLLKSFYAKLLAAERANKKLSPARRLATAELIQLTKELDLWAEETEPVRLNKAAKANGGERFYFSFGIRHRTRQYLCCMALEPFLLPAIRTDQYAVRGRGTGKAIAAIKDKIEQGEAKFFTELDITDFYPSVGLTDFSSTNDSTLKDWLPLPERVILTSIIAKHFNIDQAHCRKHSIPIDRTLASRRGIPQGSPVSTLIAEYVMAQILNAANRELPGDVSHVGFADNIAVLGKSRKSVEQAKRTLERSIERCRYGSLRSKCPVSTRRVDHGFNFLGYHLRSERTGTGRRVGITATEKNEAKFQDKIRRHLKASQQGHDRPTISAIAATIGSWCSAFSQSPYIRPRAGRLGIEAARKTKGSNGPRLVRAALTELFEEGFLVTKGRRSRALRAEPSGRPELR